MTQTANTTLKSNGNLRITQWGFTFFSIEKRIKIVIIAEKISKSGIAE